MGSLFSHSGMHACMAGLITMLDSASDGMDDLVVYTWVVEYSPFMAVWSESSHLSPLYTVLYHVVPQKDTNGIDEEMNQTGWMGEYLQGRVSGRRKKVQRSRVVLLWLQY